MWVRFLPGVQTSIILMIGISAAFFIAAAIFFIQGMKHASPSIAKQSFEKAFQFSLLAIMCLIIDIFL